jgi:hypothetical protein
LSLAGIEPLSNYIFLSKYIFLLLLVDISSHQVPKVTNSHRRLSGLKQIKSL